MINKHPIVEDFLSNPAIRKLARRANKQKEIPIYKLQFPDIEELKREAYSWTQSLFNNNQIGDPRPDTLQHMDRLVLLHPEGFRVRTYFASGYMEYRDLERTYAGKCDLSTIEEANSIVQEFGSRHNLWPFDSEQHIQVENIKFVRSQGVSSNHEQTQNFTNNIIVDYKRLTNGIPWIGPGSRITAMIEGRDVVAFQRYWRKIIPGQSAVVLNSIENTIESMVNWLSRCCFDNKSLESGDIRIEQVEFGYYGCEKRKLQRFLQPAYIVYVSTAERFGTVAFAYTQVAHDKQLEKIVDEEEESHIKQFKASANSELNTPK